jgi:hypothetical protein
MKTAPLIERPNSSNIGTVACMCEIRLHLYTRVKSGLCIATTKEARSRFRLFRLSAFCYATEAFIYVQQKKTEVEEQLGTLR